MKKTCIYSLLLCSLLIGCFPKPSPYPYKPADMLVKEAQALSKKTEDYVYAWLKGEKPAQMPQDVIPEGFDTSDCKNFFLQKYEDLDPAKQWVIRPSRKVNFDAAHSGAPDPHATYLLLGTSYAPFGTKIVIEGEYPYCRFFTIQVSPPFSGREYCPQRGIGPAEISLVDADIKPLPDNANPFLPGANRLNKNRKYKVEFMLSTGEPTQLNPDFKYPYRSTQNLHYAGLLQNRGPWGKILGIEKRSGWNMGAVWIRYYAIDKDKNDVAGVPLPKIYYQLPSGEKYFINSDYSNLVKLANQPFKLEKTAPKEPKGETMGPNYGWGKSFGILHSIGVGIMNGLNRVNPNTMKYVRDVDLGATGRGGDQPAPANYEPHATSNNYATYLGRSMNLGKNKVIILTGKLPTYPNTRIGASKFETGQVRYFSITGYDFYILRKSAGCAVHSIMDDEIILNKDREYIIVYSRPEDRPANATKENGVTWVDWGPTADLGLIVRWISVSNDWVMQPNPHEGNLPWKKAAFGSTQYDKNLLAKNDTTGFLGKYQPVIHYMLKKDFEALGNKLESDKIPAWRTNQ